LSGGVRCPSLAGALRAGLTLGAMMAIACTSHDTASRDARDAEGSTRASSAAVHGDSAVGSAAARDAWSVAEITKRLAEAGLIVSDEGKTVHYPGLQHAGQLLQVSGSDLQIYVYDNAADRRRDGAGLDTTNAGAASIGVPLRPHFIITNNLIALHFTLNGRLAERVHDVLLSRHRGGG